MLLKRLNLINFRNYSEIHINFYDGINILYGENGAGKTNILESIYYLALTKSFRTNVDKHLVLNKSNMFRILGEFEIGSKQTFQSSIAYSPSEGKRLTVNNQKISKFSDYIGQLPIVLLSTSDLQLSQGSPAQKRRFIDVLLCQSSRLYLHHLMHYNRSLRHRNQLLQPENKNRELLLAWEENLINNGTHIIKKRGETVEVLSKQVQSFYKKLSNGSDNVKFVYQTNVSLNDWDNLHSNYRNQFNEKRSREYELETTVVGPHRDDLLFLINGKVLKSYASQGEHKTFIVALKLAELYYLLRQQSESPILLFDDIFGELDAGRIQKLLDHLSEIGQVFITTTSKTFFDKLEKVPMSVHYYHVENGNVSAQAA
jgi:DNA replication and repair protein RecF